MRLRDFAWFGLVAALMGASAGCQRWRDRNAVSRGNDPLYQRRDTYGAPIPADPSDPRLSPGRPGGPEVLTPQPYPMEGNPPPSGMPPTSSGYGGVTPADHLQFMPPMTGPSTAEPPLARATPPEPPVKTVPRPLPPDLRDPKTPRPAAIPPMADAIPTPEPPRIEAFAEPKPRIASGHKPDTDGLDWLQTNKYRTVLNLRRPGADDSSDREQVNGRGLKYLSLEVSPEALTRDLVNEFAKIVNNPANQPLFIYDKDGTAAGAMWFLHFRLADKMPDELARTKAEAYGLRVKGDDEQTAYWAAIQLLLKNDKPE
jgi:protein tyrosine phosphatase (PTP) superfamily phosphohydrolase (DUF442 family)